jgi:uncharacterized repeat protein (TIGR01451 family)
VNNTATVRRPGGPGDADSASFGVPSVYALQISKSPSMNVVVSGDILTFTITVHNTGSHIASFSDPFAVIDMLPV